MKRQLIAGFSAALLAGSLAACSPGSEEAASGEKAGAASNRVALIAKANSAEYWMKVKEGALAAGKDLGVEVTFNGPDTESEGDKQLNQLESAINDHPLGIGFAPQDGAQDGSPRLLEKAEAEGIPVVIFDTPLATSDIPITTVASDNQQIGADAAKHLSELVGGSGKVAIIAHGEVGTAAARRDGFTDWLSQNAPEMEVVDIQNGESDPAKSRDKAQGILQAHPDLVGFYGTDDDSVIAIADEVQTKGLDVKVVGVDATPDVVTLIKDGSIAGILVQNPYGMGYKTVEILVAAAAGELPAETNIVEDSVWVTQENIDDPEVQQIL